MASNRLRLLRVHEIDRVIRAGEFPNASSLASSLEVHRRTIQRDLEFLRDSVGAPLEYDPAKRGYFYSEPAFALPAIELCESEIHALEAARRYLGRLVGSTLGSEIEGLLVKLEELTSSERRQGKKSIETLLPGAQTRARTSIYEEVRSAIREGCRIRSEYETSDGRLVQRDLDPYDLVFWDGAWYVVGFCHLRGEPRIFALVRLRTATRTHERFDVPSGWSLERYLEGAFSFYVAPESSKTVEVRLVFTGYAARYVSERHWHDSQIIEMLDDARMRLEMTVPVTPALERFILGWADEVVVESPPELAYRIAQRHGVARNAYGRVRAAVGSA